MKTLLLLLAFVLIAPSLSAQKVSERRYTVKEIDELREVCDMRYVWGTTVLGFDPTGGIHHSRTYREIERVTAVEQMIRTYMMAGITAKQIREEDKRLAEERITFFNASLDTMYVAPEVKQKRGK